MGSFLLGTLALVLVVLVAGAQVASASSVCCQLEGTAMNASDGRMLGLDLLDTASGRTFSDNVVDAKSLGSQFIALHVLWSKLEPSPGNFTDPGDALSLLSGVATANDWKFSVTIRPIDLTGKTVPSDLNTTRFNNATFITRFHALIDFVLTKVPPTQLLSLQIGNEIDGYNTAANSEPSSFWSDYGVFLDNCTKYVHDTYGAGVLVGFTGTFHGMVESGTLRDLGVWKALAGVVDVVGVTYYPQNALFQVHTPSASKVEADMAALVSEFSASSGSIFLQEVGFQTSADCSSSEDLQAVFYCNFFQAWDKYRDKIRAANIVRLVDYSPSHALSSAGGYGLSASSAFVSYLETLGLRNYTSTADTDPKEGFYAIQHNAFLRGWNSTDSSSSVSGKPWVCNAEISATTTTIDSTTVVVSTLSPSAIGSETTSTTGTPTATAAAPTSTDDFFTAGSSSSSGSSSNNQRLGTNYNNNFAPFVVATLISSVVVLLF